MATKKHQRGWADGNGIGIMASGEKYLRKNGSISTKRSNEDESEENIEQRNG